MAGSAETGSANAMRCLTGRPMREQDIAKVMQIEVAAYPQPWNESVFSDCLRAGYQCTLYDWEDELVGYSVMSTTAGKAHLLNLCIHPAHQGNEFGREVLEQVLMVAYSIQVRTVFLEVRVSNLAARRLYESASFNEIGQRFNYYPATHGREDALVFARTLL